LDGDALHGIGGSDRRVRGRRVATAASPRANRAEPIERQKAAV
jgi:hypothetical protein